MRKSVSKHPPVQFLRLADTLSEQLGAILCFEFDESFRTTLKAERVERQNYVVHGKLSLLIDCEYLLVKIIV